VYLLTVIYALRSSGKRVFIASLQSAAAALHKDEDESNDASSAAESQQNFLKAIALVSGGKKEEAPTVDVLAKLEAAGLSGVFPVEVWPESETTRQLAAWVKNKKKHDGENAYVFTNFRRFRFHIQ